MNILEDCKSCTTCNVRPADKGTDSSGADALGEVVGLRSMLGEPANPSNETNVSLSTSVASHNTDRPWYEYHSNSSQFGSLVNVWIGGEGVGYEPYGGKSFDSLYEKFESAFFYAVSFVTTTGFTYSDYLDWNNGSLIIIFVLRNHH